MKIQKDNIIIECSKNTYECMYKRLGYEIVTEKEEIKEEIKEEVTVETKKTKKK